ncbi:MAG: AAA family ATPase [Bacteroidaceae bacterium]|nr:AAA family ATPase [Bacteroidaceae bacterium]
MTLLEQQSLLRIEYEHEKAEFRRETELFGIGRKVKRGECWFPVQFVRRYYNAMNKLTLEFRRTDDTDIEHSFEYGKRVAFFSVDGTGKLNYYPFLGTVSFAESDRMVITLDNEDQATSLQSCEKLGIQLSFDETTYRLMFEALSRAINTKDGRIAAFRDFFYGNSRPAFSSSITTPSLPWLNASQQEAVGDVLRAKDFMVVHGPPGTGKTTTLVEAICEVLRREPQVMVCAQSNTAVDWISEQLSDRGISVLRIGNPTRVTDKMLQNTYERRFEAHPDYAQLWAIRKAIRQLQSVPRRSRTDSHHQKISRLRERADELEIRINQSLFDTSRVIACTLAGSAQQVLMGWKCHTLFIDEAAQALEAACWIALPKCHRVILAGDHCQLPPTIKSPEAMRGGLATTLMERLVDKHPHAVRLLTTQYRMNETLMRFPSQWFYGGKLKAALEVKHRNMLDDLDSPLVWIETDEEVTATSNHEISDFSEQFVAGSYGRINKREAQLTVQALLSYTNRMGTKRLLDERIDIGIISPYRAQVQYLRKLIKSERQLRPLRQVITINTVDAFQGQERDIIIVSLVRANERGDIGFLRDLRRMNVAITRARSKLILIGHSPTLCCHRFYRDLYKHCKIL